MVFHPTKRLGDTVHVLAVASAMQVHSDNGPLEVYAPYAQLFRDLSIPFSESVDGTGWRTKSRPHQASPRHGEHIRRTMYKAAREQGELGVFQLRAARNFRSDVPYAVICPHAAVEYKEWRNAQWAELAEHLLRLGLRVIVCGNPTRDRFEVPQGVELFDVDVMELAALVSAARVLISPDSGQIHLADALDTPVVGLYAATSTTTYGPYRGSTYCVDKHRELYVGTYNSARHLTRNALRSISTDEVIAKLELALRDSLVELAKSDDR